jgi:hypothetical protein
MSRPAARGATWATVCALARKLPGVEEGICFRTPALYVKKKFLADHYRPYPAMLVRLKEVRKDLLARLVEDAWRRQAPRTLVAKSERRSGHRRVQP